MFNLAPPSKLTQKVLSTSVALALTSPTWAVDVNSWEDFENQISSGENTFTITSNLTATNRITSDQNISLDLQGFSISPTSTSNSLVFFTKGLDLKNSGSFSINEETGEIASVKGGITGLNGAISVQGSAMNENVSVHVDNVVFSNSKGQYGAGFQYIETTRGWNKHPNNQVSLTNSVFYKNQSVYGAAAIDRASSAQIVGTLFDSNTASSYGGALHIERSQGIVIKDTSFYNNSAEMGGAVYIGVNSVPWIQFGGGDGEKSVLEAEYDDWSQSYGPYAETMNVSILAENKDVIFRGNTAEKGSDIYIDHGVAKPSSGGSVFNRDEVADVNFVIAANNGRKVEFNGDIVAEGKTNSFYINSKFVMQINPEESQNGEIIFNGKVSADSYPELQFYRGTISLGSGDALSEMPLTFMTPDASVLRLNLSQGTINNYKFAETSFDRRGDYHLSVNLDVDLANQSVDTINWGKFSGSGTLFVDVAQWNVLSDMNAGVQFADVTVNNGTDNNRLKYGLTDEAAKATGKLYIYDVSLLNAEDGTYRFQNAGVVPEPEPEPEPVPDPEPEPTPEPTPDPYPEPTPSEPVKPMTPADFNSEVYAGAITQKVTQLLQHEISYRLFDMNLPTEQLTVSVSDSLTKGSAHGGQMTISLKSYGHDIDIDYGVVLFSYAINPIVSDTLDVKTGMYGGFVLSEAKDHINDIDSKGAFIGVASKFSLGNAFADWHANIGYLDSKFGSKLGGSTDTDHIWIGTGLSLGYGFNFENCGLDIIPSLDAIYTFVDGKDFKSAHNVSIDNGDFSGWELSPGVRVEKTFGANKTWRLYGETRYVWSDDSTDLKAVKLTNKLGQGVADQVLPSLQYGDYTEMNLGLKRDFGSWQIHAGADCRVGDIDGWGFGVAARWHF